MAVKATSVEVSLRDVEPIKSFIQDIKLIYADDSVSADVRDKIRAACRKLDGGFLSMRSAENKCLAEWRGWKLKSPSIPQPDKWPSVCIVIPVYNSPALLRHALVTLMRTDYPGELMYTLVDNASTDAETLELLNTRDFTPVRFDEPVGFATAVNAGMKQVDADYYVLFNQDCAVIEEDWLTRLIEWMEYRPQCAVAGPKLVYPTIHDEQIRQVQHAGIEIPEGTCAKHRYLGVDADDDRVNYYEKVQAVTGAVFAIRGRVLAEVGYLDEGYKFGCEDIEYCLRVAAQAGHEVWYVPTSTVEHRDHGVRNTNTKQSSRIRDWSLQSTAKFRKDWGSFVDRCATESVAIVLPDYNPVAGGCRVVAALANRFITAGMETTIYVMNNRRIPDDADFPKLFEIKHISALKGAGTIIATRFDTVEATIDIPAVRRYYLVQQIETPMAKYCGATEEDVLRSYQHTEYEIITIGEHLAAQLSEMGRTCRVFDVGLYTGLYAPNTLKRCAEPSKLRILMYGSPADYKGGQDAPAIAAALRDRFGDRVSISSFHRDLPAPGWADNHYQPQSTKEVAQVYADHDIYVYASHSDGFAMTPIEAMACGTPVVLTDFPGKDQYARDNINCLIAPFRDAQGIADAAERIITERAVRRELLMEGADTARHYDWSRVGIDYVREVLGAPL